MTQRYWRQIRHTPRYDEGRGGRASRSNVRRNVYAGSVGSVWISQMGNVGKHVDCHTFRYSFVTHLHEAGYDIRMIHEPLGQKNVSTTMICTHVLNKGGHEVRSPIDGP